mmetsp:Transcript_67629/g.163493  ORF Transcript_67629/g.163493 Transcript_67629/m.163493 type:complete len:273 (+) Transcript_67629:2487-3305(+)
MGAHTGRPAVRGRGQAAHGPRAHPQAALEHGPHQAHAGLQGRARQRVRRPLRLLPAGGGHAHAAVRGELGPHQHLHGRAVRPGRRQARRAAHHRPARAQPARQRGHPGAARNRQHRHGQRAARGAHGPGRAPGGPRAAQPQHQAARAAHGHVVPLLHLRRWRRRAGPQLGDDRTGGPHDPAAPPRLGGRRAAHPGLPRPRRAGRGARPVLQRQLRPHTESHREQLPAQGGQPHGQAGGRAAQGGAARLRQHRHRRRRPGPGRRRRRRPAGDA